MMTNVLQEMTAIQIATNKLLENYLNKTDNLTKELEAKEDTNMLLKENNQLLEEIKQQGEDKTFENTTDVENQLNEADAGEGGVHLFSGKVRFPQDAFGFFSLEKNYNKNEAPGKKTLVNIRLEPTFVTKLESKTRKMGLEIHLVLMWEESEKRVNWKMKEKLKAGTFFHFSPSILE